MLKLALRGLAQRRARTVLTSLAVVLGVALVAGTFVFTDTIQASFDDLISRTQQGIDVKVVPKEPEISNDNDTSTLDARIVDRLKGVQGVEAISGALTAPVVIVDAKGKQIGGGGAPSIGVSAGPDRFDPLTYEGRPPRAADEVAVDRGTADKGKFKVGDAVRVGGDGPVKSYQLVGIGRLGDVNSLGGSAVAVLSLPELQRIARDPGRISEVDIAAMRSTTSEVLRDRVRAVAGRGVEVRTGQEDTEKQTADVQDGLGFLTTALLVFAVVALLVGAFSIFNAFSITVAQRTREFGLLRTIGASRRQVLSAVIAEALLVGLLGSIAGLALGIALAPALNALFEAIGIDLPSSGIVIAARTIVVALLVGTLVTLFASVAPALRATRVSPMAALTAASGAAPPRPRKRRTVIAVLVMAAGVVLLCVGLFGGGDTNQVLALLGVGAVLIFLGVALVSPLLVAPLAAVVGAPLERIGGVSGRIARGNAVRNPGRTAGTAAALMIGLALVAFTTIFAAGIKASFSDSFDKAVVADLVITVDGPEGVPDDVGDAVAKVPGVGVATRLKGASAQLVRGRKDISVAGLEPGQAPAVLRVQWKDGSDATLRSLTSGNAVIEDGFASDNKLKVGSSFTVRTAKDTVKRLTVKGTYTDRGGLIGDVTVPASQLTTDFGARTSNVVLLDVGEGSDVAAVQRRVNGVLESQFPTLESRTGKQFIDDAVGQVNQIVYLFYALLSLAVLISLFGIVNTLALSIYERTRELGLLRAVGTSRRQVRRIVRGEAVITALIGGVLGLAIGVFFAVIISRPLADEGFVLSFPVAQLIVLLMLAALAGILAAVLPARRASRIDVLEALAYE